MPRHYWVYALFTLMGVFVSVTVVVLGVSQVRWLWAFAGLPSFAGAPRAGGAIYQGALEGPAETTPLGHVAVAWVGVVTQTTRQGKSSYTAEKCRLGRVTELHLTGDGQRWAIGAPDLRAIELKIGFRGPRDLRTRYWLGPTEKVSPVPDDIVARCHIDREALAKGDWKYAEQSAPPGAHVEFAGCAVDDVLGSCGNANGVALGHLSTAGMRAMVRQIADGTMETIAPLISLMMLFAVVGAGGAVLALRAAAPTDVLHPERWR